MRSPRHRLAGLVLAAALCSAGATASAEPAADSRIVGGEPAARSYPHQALLRVRTAAGTTRCGGSLVAARYVVTAAHCLSLDGRPATSIDVTLGAADVSSTPPNFHATTSRAHPRYDGDPGNGYDVAVIRLDRAAPLEQVRLLRPADTAKWAPGTTATLIGWGLTEDEAQGGRQSDQLREVRVPVFSDAACADDFAAAGAPPRFFSPLTMFCAGGKDGKDACQGDSGGPLLVPDGSSRLALAGVVSFGAVRPDGDACANGLPGIFARAAADPINQWIRSLVPQVEIDASPAAPDPGRRVSLKAVGGNTAGAYQRFEWDLDGDGAFDDAIGDAAAVTATHGVLTIGVRATRGIGEQRDQEVRRIDIDSRARSTLAFAAPAVTVTEGEDALIAISKTGRGAGTVGVAVTAGTAAVPGADGGPPSRSQVAFAAEQSTQVVKVPTFDDDAIEPAETFTVALGGHGGELAPGDRGEVTVTILDDDAHARITGLSRSLRTKRGTVTLRYRIDRAATVSLGVSDARGRLLLAAGRRTHPRAGTYSAVLRLRRAAVRRLSRSRSRRIGARALYAVVDGDHVVDSRVRRLQIRR